MLRLPDDPSFFWSAGPQAKIFNVNYVRLMRLIRLMS